MGASYDYDDVAMDMDTVAKKTEQCDLYNFYALDGWWEGELRGDSVRSRTQNSFLQECQDAFVIQTKGRIQRGKTCSKKLVRKRVVKMIRGGGIVDDRDIGADGGEERRI